MAADVLRRDGLVAMPTETVYGLAANAMSDKAIKTLYRVKGRPAHNPLITHVLRPEDAGHFATIDDLSTELMARIWPGPLTLVLPRRTCALSTTASAGLATIALRCPDAPWRDGLLAAGWDKPLVMPSANLSGHVSPTTASHVAEDLGDRIALILDGGPCTKGIESTVIAVADGRVTLLRDGALRRADIEQITGSMTQVAPGSEIASPGMLERHYAPAASLRLNATLPREGETLIGFGPDFGAPNLAPEGDLKDAARSLYAMLRKHDGPDVKLAVAPIPDMGLGRAINDRLRRAAKGR